LDEPTVGVDVQSKNVIIEHLQKLNAQGTTIIYTSHHLNEAEHFCTRVAIIDRGVIVAKGTPKTLIASQENARNLEDVFLSLTGKALRDDT
ncbi:MAG: ABC-2 type transport system ATP-binding protein, partial [Patiriisocius sp.]